MLRKHGNADTILQDVPELAVAIAVVAGRGVCDREHLGISGSFDVTNMPNYFAYGKGKHQIILHLCHIHPDFGAFSAIRARPKIV